MAITLNTSIFGIIKSETRLKIILFSTIDSPPMTWQTVIPHHWVIWQKILILWGETQISKGDFLVFVKVCFSTRLSSKANSNDRCLYQVPFHPTKSIAHGTIALPRSSEFLGNDSKKSHASLSQANKETAIIDSSNFQTMLTLRGLVLLKTAWPQFVKLSNFLKDRYIQAMPQAPSQQS